MSLAIGLASTWRPFEAQANERVEIPAPGYTEVGVSWVRRGTSCGDVAGVGRAGMATTPGSLWSPGSTKSVPNLGYGREISFYQVSNSCYTIERTSRSWFGPPIGPPIGHLAVSTAQRECLLDPSAHTGHTGTQKRRRRGKRPQKVNFCTRLRIINTRNCLSGPLLVPPADAAPAPGRGSGQNLRRSCHDQRCTPRRERHLLLGLRHAPR